MTEPTTTAGPTITEAFTAWMARQPAGVRPEVIAELSREATILGLGTSTREGREVLDAVVTTTMRVVAEGFATIALVDHPRVVAAYDRYIHGDDVDVEHALSQAWGPWRTREMEEVLERLRSHNLATPDAAVRMIGIGPARALPADNDEIVRLLARVDRNAAARVEELLDVIRVVHDSGEHVLRARGTHPGTPFVELARAARAEAARVPAGPERQKALELLDGVVELHANAIGVGFDAEREERQAAQRLLDHRRRTGERIVLWEGSSHVAAAPGPSIGSHLRDAPGERYTAVHVTFGSGRIPDATIPAPQVGSLESHLVAAGGERTIDLGVARTATAAAFDRTWSTRIVSGMYDPARDSAHYLEVPSLPDSFDALIHVPTISPVHPLPPARRDPA
ncbi:erythromycin esterase family protein [Actinomarinicola tropica]|uniref:Erythromycin esterase family protein n=1 Tax=Actinomarinicola tropica TaxID=2789776 RepID=A0A5Q2RIM1_9ACTN|nr:erythromycin esterase family protein [Actinomarinicola tropica]QGG96629.1 hypothetical protein GH723_16845 [Actinomarinicola tropica]